jgi:signal transduction histidine kinase
VKKVALLFVTAVFVPSLLLAWLAVRSLRDQQLILERQQSLLYQGVADALAREAENFLSSQQRDFGEQVETLITGPKAASLNFTFDENLRAGWPCAEVGFVVLLNSGRMTCPSPTSSTVATAFCTDFGKFLGNRESAEVYWNASQRLNGGNFTDNGNLAVSGNKGDNNLSFDNNSKIGQQLGNSKMVMNNLRQVTPQQNPGFQGDQNQFSKVTSAEAEFGQLVGEATEGTVARFVENKLKVLLWHRSPRDTNVIFGAQLSLDRLKQNLRPMVDKLDPALRADAVVALLDDMARPVAVSYTGFRGNWKHPFVATEVGEALPHWEMAVYLINPGKLAQSARTLRLTLGLLTGLLLLAIGIGGWLIVMDLNRELTLARQKTDFVSNVSHELKTPLTSIRMFSELLAEGRVAESEKRQTYLNIITAEASRLTRLINNVLDFSRMERGEKKYHFEKCDVVSLALETVETYQPHLEAAGFEVHAKWPEVPIMAEGDRDALAQVIVNLLSNAEKYSDGGKEISVEMELIGEPLPHVELRVLDRGKGVPRGCEERIFEKFYRAHDSLGHGIQGSGLGLTLARQIARAHGGDVVYRVRQGGGSCFILRLPTKESR